MEEQYFDEMRQQMAALKEQLNKQEIVNDHLIREIMKVKNKDISKTKNVSPLLRVPCSSSAPLPRFISTVL